MALAQRDLNEALSLSKTKPAIDFQIKVQEAFTRFYTKKDDPAKAQLATDRIVFLKDSVFKQAENQKLALLKQQRDAEQLALKQKQALLQQEASRLQKLVQQKNTITIITIAIIAAITTLLILLYFKRKRKS
jgi:hypothetical protein